MSELPECTVDVSDSATYVAFFSPDSYLVSLRANPDASGALQGAGTYKFGDTVELNAQPTSGKRFVGWYLVESEGEEAAASNSVAGSNGASGDGASSNAPATLFSKDAHYWFTIDEDLIRDTVTANSVLRRALPTLMRCRFLRKLLFPVRRAHAVAGCSARARILRAITLRCKPLLVRVTVLWGGASMKQDM